MAEYITSTESDARDLAPRYKFLYGLVSLTAALFLGRLWFLQIINGDELRQFSERISIKETKIAAPRGIIFDRNGDVLVENLPGFEATISPQYVKDYEALAANIAEALGTTPNLVAQTIQKSKRLNGPFRTIRVKENLSREEILNLELIKMDNPGLDIKESVLRYYPMGPTSAHLLGYVAEISKRQLSVMNEKFAGRAKFAQGDIIGKAGIEEKLDLYLRGKDGTSMVQVDVRGRETISETPTLVGEMKALVPALPGNNVILTIDKDIQETAFNAMMSQNRIGAAVAMKTNGEILAWVSTPSFDPNEFSTGISPSLWSRLVNDPDKPLRNKVIQDHNSPGSTFKPLIAIAALSENAVSRWTSVSCPGVFRFGGRPYHDTVRNGHGDLTIEHAIEKSANIFFYKMGIQLGIDKMFKYCHALGIGQSTGIDMNNEVAGLMPSQEWKKETYGEDWQPGENLSNAIGQGFVLTTPLQIAVAYNAIGTYGKVVKPFVIKSILGSDNKLVNETKPEIVRDLLAGAGDVKIRKDVFDTVKEGMRLVVNSDRGTARGSVLHFIEMAGKTGTSQVMSSSADQIYASCEGKPKNQRHHGWFVGYAPADNPEITFAILAEHSCHGSSGAAPVAKEIVRSYVAKYHPDWLSRELHKKKPIAIRTEVIEGE
jgi:penicillin-binding protein 2